LTQPGRLIVFVEFGVQVIKLPRAEPSSRFTALSRLAHKLVIPDFHGGWCGRAVAAHNRFWWGKLAI
jgi:hypothetical protein